MNRAPTLPGLALLLAMLAPYQAARADSVHPALPEAYAPFEIEADWRSGTAAGQYPYALVLNDQDQVVLIGYRSQQANSDTMRIQVQGLPPGNYEVAASPEPFLPGGKVENVSYRFSFDVAAAPRTQAVYAFYHQGIGHYFITASPREAEGLLAEGGWELVDTGFNVWPKNSAAPSSAVPVCRFYSYVVNSHFYTAGPNECRKLREEDHGWTYEGIAFQALPPVDGACLPGTMPVRRMYNNRAADLDSNHRFTPSRETYRDMVTDGWLAEGIAFCSPPAAN